MFELETAFLTVKSRAELAALLRLVFTPGEIKQYRKRWKAVQMSATGETQRHISRTLKVGLATATRAAKAARDNRATLELVLRRAEA
jgi:uncharacterized protein YerC